MGHVRSHRPAMLMLAAFSRHEHALDWAREQVVDRWGPVALASEVFSFEQTGYYERSMGAGLKKILLAFANFIDPADLVHIKHETNQWEDRYRDGNDWPEERPLNLDPGYLTEAKLVLATTKDRDHRIYLGQGIFAEVTLYYRRGEGWQAHEWTYPDYRSQAYHEFLQRCRNHLRERR